MSNMNGEGITSRNDQKVGIGLVTYNVIARMGQIKVKKMRYLN